MRMHTTTVRFGDDLWAQLVAAATREHCSIGEYVREATTRRLAGRRPANLGPSRHGKEAAPLASPWARRSAGLAEVT